MSRAQLLARLSGLALFSLTFPSLAQSPGASPAPSTSTPPASPPAPPPGDAAAPAAETPAPAAAPPAGDSWSELMRQGHQQERANETDEERETREQEPRLAAEALQRRNRVRFFPWVGLGVQLSPNLGDSSYDSSNSSPVTQTTVDKSWLQEGVGWNIDLGVGVRGGVAQHFDLQARLALTIEGTSVGASASVRLPGISSSSTAYGDGSLSIVGARLDATVRWLPGLLAPRFFVGAGPSAEASSASGSGTLDTSGSPTFERSQTILSILALLELGVIFGGNEEWEAALRSAAGPTDEGTLRGFVLATAARSF